MKEFKLTGKIQVRCEWELEEMARLKAKSLKMNYADFIRSAIEKASK